MADQQIIDYIKKARNDGHSDEQIKRFLLTNGRTGTQVDDAFLAITQPQNPISSQRDKTGFPALKLILIILILVIIGAGCYLIINQTSLVQDLFKSSTKGNDILNDTKPANFEKGVSTKYNLEITKFTPAVPEYKIALNDLSNLSNFQTADGNFSQNAKASLTSDNFFIAKNNSDFYKNDPSAEYSGRNDDWTELYSKIGGSYFDWERYPENSVFITSDFLTHTYHKLIDEEFTFIEENNFYPTLDKLSEELLNSSIANYKKESNQQQKDSHERLSAYFLVTSSILSNARADYNTLKQQNFVSDTGADTKEAVLTEIDSIAKAKNISEDAKNIAKEEINLIFGATAIAPSPLMGKYQPAMYEDYTQYGPRSHYTKNVILRNYFRAMMFYGRMNFLLKSPELTRDAVNISLLLSPEQLKQWESIYNPTAFFVGQTDDLSLYDYGQAENKTGFNTSDKSDSAVLKLQNELLTYKNPQIMSSVIVERSVATTTKEDLQKSTKGFRFMGQRFTPDAFVFSTLTQGDELADPKTGQRLPSTPTALMIPTLMGSQEAGKLLDSWIKNNAPNSDKVIADRLATLQDYFNKTTQPQWTQNIYWSWLYTIKSLFNITNTHGYPMFIKNENWDKKILQTFLGSWTELKHDTLLYAKQSYAEKGAGGGEEPPPLPVPKGYVEPNIDFLDRLIALVNLTNDGLKEFGIVPSDFEWRTSKFVDALQFYRKIAVAQLQNEKISEEDFETLRLSPGGLDQILQTPNDGVQLEKNARSALIADVHTDALQNKILYEASGIPNYIYVAVKDVNGTRLTKGLVYAYYEFTSPIGKRLTDQDWQEWSYSDKASIPSMPLWNKELVK